MSDLEFLDRIGEKLDDKPLSEEQQKEAYRNNIRQKLRQVKFYSDRMKTLKLKPKKSDMYKMKSSVRIQKIKGEHAGKVLEKLAML